MDLADPVAKEGEADAEPKMERLAEEKGTNRKEKRKAMKKMKRKQTRKEMALKEREEEEAILNDPQELMKIKLMEQEEAERSERERKLFEERERAWIEAMEIKRKKQIEEEEEEEERRMKPLEEEELSRKQQVENENDGNEVDDWDYIEEGPAEIIWQGNEIIVKKKRIKVPKRNTDQQSRKEDCDRPTSNPLPPQSEAFSDYKNSSMSAQQLIENVAQQVPHFGTEQHTDEEVERCYEEFYEDVHTEFLKFGEIINFKVCRNGAFHLRGNVYIHYKSLDSAVLAHQSINGRYFAGKQISCEFINVTRWKVAICGEYMKSRYKTCSHGTACNFIHCFRNPGGDYEWGDSDRPAPKYWVRKMVALFGYSDADEKQMVEENFGRLRNSSKMTMADSERYSFQIHGRYGLRRSRSRGRDYSSFIGSGRRYDSEDYVLEDAERQRHTGDDRHRGKTLDEDRCEENKNLKDYHCRKSRRSDTEFDRQLLDREEDRDRHHGHTRKSSRQRNRDHKNKTYETESDGDLSDRARNRVAQHGCTRESSSQQRKGEFLDEYGDWQNKNHEVDRDWSDRDKDIDAYQDNRKSSGHKRKVGCPDNHNDSKNRAHDMDEEWSDSNSKGGKHHSRRKRFGHISKASEFSNHRERTTRSCSYELSDDLLENDAERNLSHARKRSKRLDEVSDISDEDRVPTQNLEHRHDRLSLEMREAESLVKKLKSDGTHESSSLGQDGERYRSHDFDIRCISDVHMDKQDRWEPEDGSVEIFHNSKTKAGSSESFESGRPGPYNVRGESSDFDSEDKVGQEDQNESDKVAHSKHRKSRRKSTHDNRKRDSENRSLCSSQSSHRRHSNRLEATDSSEDNNESGRKHNQKHHADHRSRDHKRDHKSRSLAT
ncbi:zinc finger CCCH domain-containing protein 5 isoform X3 [Prunus dulcis]|uniref:zinc finger CCCH domain-containing protein 5 isoform X3 n=1 Tax=Prunus dulcis TaxID=3755 RepID=UPI0014830FF8|nr:zinc finger CCCH domain-containing protein 5 isoform X3 [Prunus dulcis]